MGRAHGATDGRLVERAGLLSLVRRAGVLGEPARPRADHGPDHRGDPLATARLQRRVPSELRAQRTGRLPARVRADAAARRVIRGCGQRSRSRRTGCRTRSICSSCPPTGCRSRSRHCISTSPHQDGAGPRSSPRAGCCRRWRAATTSSSSRSSSCSGWRGSRPGTSRAGSGRDSSWPGSPPRACSRRCSSGTDSIHAFYGFKRSPVEVVNYSADVAGLWSVSPDSLLWGATLRTGAGAESEIFPGVTLVLLLIAGLWLRRARRNPRVPRAGCLLFRDRAPDVDPGPRPEAHAARRTDRDGRPLRALHGPPRLQRDASAGAALDGVGPLPRGARGVRDRADRVAPRATAGRRPRHLRPAARRMAARLSDRRGAGDARDGHRRPRAAGTAAPGKRDRDDVRGDRAGAARVQRLQRIRGAAALRDARSARTPRSADPRSARRG